MLLQLGDVSFGYPGTEIFAGLTLQVNPGDRIGLVGPNGAGKSTALRLMSGALKPDQGAAYWEEQKAREAKRQSARSDRRKADDSDG